MTEDKLSNLSIFSIEKEVAKEIPEDNMSLLQVITIGASFCFEN